MSKWKVEFNNSDYGYILEEKMQIIKLIPGQYSPKQIEYAVKCVNGYEAMRGVLSNIHAVIALQGQLVIKKDSILYDALTKVLRDTCINKVSFGS